MARSLCDVHTPHTSGSRGPIPWSTRPHGRIRLEKKGLGADVPGESILYLLAREALRPPGRGTAASTPFHAPGAASVVEAVGGACWPWLAVTRSASHEGHRLAPLWSHGAATCSKKAFPHDMSTPAPLG